MPTLFPVGAYRVTVYPNDHRPGHVHAVGPDGEAIFLLNCPTGPVTLREVRGKVGLKTVERIGTEIEQRLQKACAGWRKYHADY